MKDADWKKRAEAAEARVRKLEQRCEASVRQFLDANGRSLRAGQKLADANALLERIEQDPQRPGLWYRDLRAHLAGQPAAPSRTEAPLTDREKAVLDDAKAIPREHLDLLRACGTVYLSNLAVSELARRGLK